MEETTGDPGPSESETSSASWWSSGFTERLQSVSLASPEENLSTRDSACSREQDQLSPLAASQILWETGAFSGVIPDGFYSVLPETKLKQLFHNIPPIDELYSMGLEGLKADVILVDSEKDKKLSKLKNFIVALVKGLHSNPTSMVKKIAGVVCNFYKRPASELSPAKSPVEDLSLVSENHVVQLLGQIKNGLCRPRAILFKVLADAVGFECKLMVGLPNDSVGCFDQYKHMSVIVELNSVELLVDLMKLPGQLVPFSNKTLMMYHISATGESDSAENDSCDSPLEPNSPLYGLCEKIDSEGGDHDDNSPHGFSHRRNEGIPSASGTQLRSILLRPLGATDSKLSVSHSEPNIANAFWRRSRRKVIAEQRTASSSALDNVCSPEHPLFRARGRSMLGANRQTFAEDDSVTASRSDGAATSEPRRIRRRSISITPEISDDIVRAVRAMNETLKQNRLLKESADDESVGHLVDRKNGSSSRSRSVASFHQDVHEAVTVESGAFSRNQANLAQKAISLPSSPSRGQASERGVPAEFDMLSTWNKVLESSSFVNKPLLPFQDWNIDFSELTIGTRVGIGFFGEVFRGIWNGTDVAIKIFLEQDLTAENMEDFCNEISLLSRLRHPNVILFLGACTKPPHLSMVTEYMEMGSLYYLIHMSGQKKKLSWRRRLKMLRDICRGLMYIHRMKIVHRDLKSANCLVNKHWTVKICDLGLSRMMVDAPMRDSSSAGTPEWMAPELIRNEPFTEKCDIFSFGVIMWELCTLKRPWEGIPAMQVIYTVAQEGVRLEIPEGPLGKLISDCWAEADQRPGCEEILSRLVECEYTLLVPLCT
ncbi:serine/threonine-protein kinase CTR1-like isoform X1 [Nymphaea colorata]|nr:serine/threonine-protein kinase CTR1-like isoform X1 [Nymphaea colorata]XP_031494391.1 serine/threonine-protein kinase CTR1-like isoform X1 [Nymphaea colorata]